MSDGAEIEARLRASAAVFEQAVSTPVDLQRRVLALTSRTRSRSPIARRLMTLAGAGLALGLVNLAAAYFSPRYSEVLAGAPVVGSVSGSILRAAGLGADTVTPGDSVSTSSGHTLRVVGGYADGIRTLLLVEVDGRPLVVASKQTSNYFLDGYLTDQFGRRYNQIYGPESSVATRFEPLTGLSASQGARLTFHVRALMPTWKGTEESARGNWVLHATLVRRPAHELSLPAPIQDRDTVHTFTSIRSTYALQVHWTVAGPVVDRIRQLSEARSRQLERDRPAPPAVGDPLSRPAAPDPIADQLMELNRKYLWPHLYLNGKELPLGDFGWNFGAPGSTEPLSGQFNAILPGPGRYQVQFGEGGEQRSLDVPRP